MGQREVRAHHERVAEEHREPDDPWLMKASTIPRRFHAALRFAPRRSSAGAAGTAAPASIDLSSRTPAARLLQLCVDLLVHLA